MPRKRLDKCSNADRAGSFNEAAANCCRGSMLSTSTLGHDADSFNEAAAIAAAEDLEYGRVPVTMPASMRPRRIAAAEAARYRSRHAADARRFNEAAAIDAAEAARAVIGIAAMMPTLQ